MASDDNVVKIPDSLERRAKKIEAALAKREKGKEDWIDGTIELAIELAGARNELKADQAFGQWCQGRFGTNVISKNERAILVRWGENPKEIRTILEGEASMSIRVIDDIYFKSERVNIPEKRYPTAGTPPIAPLVGGDKTRAVHAAIQAAEATRTMISHRDIAKMLGVSESTVGEAARDLKAAAHSADLGPIYYTKAQDAHVEVRIKLLDKEREKEFEARVIAENQKQIASLFPDLEKLREDAKRNEKFYREQIEKQAILAEAEFNDLLFCAHWDQRKALTKERADRAFVVLNAKKLQLTGKR